MSHTIKDLVTAYGNKVIDNRRYLHAHPELSFQETDTAHWIRERLAAAGMHNARLRAFKGKIAFFRKAQGIDVGAQADRRARL